MKQRLDQYYASSPDGYLVVTLEQIDKIKALRVKAGECLCKYLDIEPRTFIFERPNGEPTLVEFLDAVQMMVPTPKKAQEIKVMKKSLCRDILMWIVMETF
jgi:hypothetical protein